MENQELGKNVGVSKKNQWKFVSNMQSYMTEWKSENRLIEKVSSAVSIATKNYIYVLGGANSDRPLNIIQRVSFDNKGNLTSTWIKVGELPTAMCNMGCVVAKNRLYLIGGFNEYGFLSSVYSASINEDGTLGSFREEKSLPDGRGGPTCFAIKDKLYVVSGFGNNDVTRTVYQTTINSDGTLNDWIILTNHSIPYPNGTPLIIKNRVYVLGFYKICCAGHDSNGNVGPWIYVTDMPDDITNSAIVITDSYVLSFGGYNNSNNENKNDVYCAAILENGNLGEWIKINNTPMAVSDAQVVKVGNKIYLIGGWNGVNHLDTVFSTEIFLHH
jgi:hypothetical protein